jgi:hypothetical protein
MSAETVSPLHGAAMLVMVLLIIYCFYDGPLAKDTMVPYPEAAFEHRPSNWVDGGGGGWGRAGPSGGWAPSTSWGTVPQGALHPRSTFPIVNYSNTGARCPSGCQ